ncbi:hypothetical protein [Flavobacterium sp. UBA7682]|uniref:hypothetical protein n=1 Tax=Flavobacterium sp. UBA7682 TaxID=1946560 RepID=UPI0025BC95B3|nr:hypothetical protein [Flavobacterium sp. UBA7682]
MTTKKLPLHLENTSFSLYGNLGERIAAGFLDGVFLTPVTHLPKSGWLFQLVESATTTM